MTEELEFNSRYGKTNFLFPTAIKLIPISTEGQTDRGLKLTLTTI
jgi:hypothetical protein